MVHTQEENFYLKRWKKSSSQRKHWKRLSKKIKKLSNGFFSGSFFIYCQTLQMGRSTMFQKAVDTHTKQEEKEIEKASALKKMPCVCSVVSAT
jgi:hypothetical protein